MKCIRTVSFSPDSKLLAAAGDAMLISAYDVASGELVFNLQGHETWIFDLDWSHSGDYVASW